MLEPEFYNFRIFDNKIIIFGLNNEFESAPNLKQQNNKRGRLTKEQWSSSVLAILFLLLLARSFSGNELSSSRSLGKNFRAQSSELLSE